MCLSYNRAYLAYGLYKGRRAILCTQYLYSSIPASLSRVPEGMSVMAVLRVAYWRGMYSVPDAFDSISNRFVLCSPGQQLQ